MDALLLRSLRSRLNSSVRGMTVAREPTDVTNLLSRERSERNRRTFASPAPLAAKPRRRPTVRAMSRAVSPDEAENRLQALLAGDWLVDAYAAVTGRGAAEVAAGLAAEADDPGSTVAGELLRRGVEPYVYSDGLEAFYRDSDAFLFELAVWNRRGFKRSMRRWTVGRAAEEAARRGRPLRVLAFGDGIGVDAAALALEGQDVTYFEVPGLSQRVAARLFDQIGVKVGVVTDLANIAGREFDAVTCFDVLEHVPDPRVLLGDLVNRLGDGGLLCSSTRRFT